LGAEGIQWWRQRFPGTLLNGSLVVTRGRDTGQLAEFARRTERFELVEGERLTSLEPELAGRFNQALFFREEGHLDPRAALRALTVRLVALGVSIRFGVTASPDELIDADCVIDCRGLSARDALADLRAVRGEMVLLRTREISLKRPVRILHPRHPAYVVPRSDGLFMVGATMIESDAAAQISVRSMMELVNAACELHPAFGEAEIVETGAGVRPAFPDNLPRIRRRADTVYVNGLFRHGFLLAPSLARMTAEVVLYNRIFPEFM
jgi:glycine oxidase